MKRSRTRRTWVLAAFVMAITIVSAGCGSAPPGRVIPAAERLAQAFVTMAGRLGTTTDDAARAFKLRFPAHTETQLADEAERVLQRTSWVENVAARLAAARAKTAKVVVEATCEWLDKWDLVRELSQADQATEFRAIIINELHSEQLSEDAQTINEVWGAVSAQLESLRTTGSIDVSAMSLDLLCELRD